MSHNTFVAGVASGMSHAHSSRGFGNYSGAVASGEPPSASSSSAEPSGSGSNPSASAGASASNLGLYPIVTFQYSPTTLYQVSYHIQYLLF